jgi:hypothetical protein
MSLTYFMQIEGPEKLVKIGKTKNPGIRFLTLKTGLPWPLRLVAMVGSDVEKDLKQRFSSDRVQGEWFRPSTAMREWLDRAAEDGRLVRQVAVDQAYMNAVIKPRIREYLNGREPENNSGGDLVRCILNDLLPTLRGRENHLFTATKGHVTHELCRGFGPTLEPPLLHLHGDELPLEARA